jgi:hypothetical protein
MNWRILSIGFTFVLTLTTSPLLLAKGDENGIAHRVAALEQQMTTLMAELESVSPVADLTGKTYCFFGHGSWLGASEGDWAKVYFNPWWSRVDFTSPTEFSAADIYDNYASVLFPDYTMVDADDSSDPFTGTYTLVGNLLTVFVEDDGIRQIGSFIMTPDGQAFFNLFAERSHMAYGDWWETGLMFGVQAENCDGLTP